MPTVRGRPIGAGREGAESSAARDCGPSWRRGQERFAEMPRQRLVLADQFGQQRLAVGGRRRCRMA